VFVSIGLAYKFCSFLAIPIKISSSSLKLSIYEKVRTLSHGNFSPLFPNNDGQNSSSRYPKLSDNQLLEAFQRSNYYYSAKNHHEKIYPPFVYFDARTFSILVPSEAHLDN